MIVINCFYLIIGWVIKIATIASYLIVFIPIALFLTLIQLICIPFYKNKFNPNDLFILFIFRPIKRVWNL